ncbi:MAG: hypothetical protein RLZZ253_330 [Verrucomicrobiota bacterium]
MNAPYTVRPLSRRRFLRSAGALVALPLLEAFRPAFARSPEEPRRLLVVSNNLGFLPKPILPKNTGQGYALPPTLAPLEDIRSRFTFLSGVSHPDVNGGHSAENCFLTAARGPTKSGFRNQISLDQFAAEKLGPLTRFSSLNLGVNIDKANRSLSWTRDGVLLPAEDNALSLFRRMFVQGNPEEVQAQLRRIEERGSVLDSLTENTREFSSQLGAGDRSRLDQYLTSVREVEQRLQSAREWELRPKPVTAHPEPVDIADKKRIFEKLDLMLEMAELAFESDSTRIVTLMVDAFATPAFQINADHATTDGYHGLSHHGQAEEKVRQLAEADRQQMVLFRKRVLSLAAKSESGVPLLDRTLFLFGTNMGDANTHDNTNLPVLLAGGGLKHGAHHAFKRDNNLPLSNLFVTLLQQLGVPTDSFGSSTGSLNHLLL